MVLRERAAQARHMRPRGSGAGCSSNIPVNAAWSASLAQQGCTVAEGLASRDPLAVAPWDVAAQHRHAVSELKVGLIAVQHGAGRGPPAPSSPSTVLLRRCWLLVAAAVMSASSCCYTCKYSGNSVAGQRFRRLALFCTRCGAGRPCAACRQQRRRSEPFGLQDRGGLGGAAHAPKLSLEPPGAGQAVASGPQARGPDRPATGRAPNARQVTHRRLEGRQVADPGR